MRKIISLFLSFLICFQLSANNPHTYQTQTITSGLGTVTLFNFSNVSNIPDFVWLYPSGGTTVSLSADLILSTTGTAPANSVVCTQIYWRGGDIDLNGHNFTAFGYSIPQWMLNDDNTLNFYFKSGTAILQAIPTPNSLDSAVYDGAVLIPSSVPLYKLIGGGTAQIPITDNSSGNIPQWQTMSGDATISSTGVLTISNGAITTAKMGTLAAGNLIIGNGSNVPTATALSGDITVNSSGVTAIGAGKVTPVMLSSSVGAVFTATVSLSSAQILALNGTPVTLVANPGVGASIVVQKVIAQQTFVTTAYTTHLTLQVYAATASIPQATVQCLDFTGSRTVNIPIYTTAPGASDTQIISNQPLNATVSGGNPAAGDGTMLITVYYEIQ